MSFRSEGSGAKHYSGFEGKISKSELSASTSEEVLYSLCFGSEGSGAKQCSDFEGKISKSDYAQAQPKKYCIYCVLELTSEGSGAKRCSGFEGRISKSEVCTGTAAELYLLSFEVKA